MKAIVDDNENLYSLIDEDNCKTLSKLHIIWNYEVDKFYDAFKKWKMLDTLILRIPSIDRESRDREVVEFWQNFPNLETVQILLDIIVKYSNEVNLK